MPITRRHLLRSTVALATAAPLLDWARAWAADQPFTPENGAKLQFLRGATFLPAEGTNHRRPRRRISPPQPVSRCRSKTSTRTTCPPRPRSPPRSAPAPTSSGRRTPPRIWSPKSWWTSPTSPLPRREARPLVPGLHRLRHAGRALDLHPRLRRRFAAELPHVLDASGGLRHASPRRPTASSSFARGCIASATPPASPSVTPSTTPTISATGCCGRSAARSPTSTARPPSHRRRRSTRLSTPRNSTPR